MDESNLRIYDIHYGHNICNCYDYDIRLDICVCACHIYVGQI